MAVAVIAAGAIVLPRLNQPVSGVISVTDSASKTGYTVNLTAKKVTGKQVSFDYPSGLTPQKADSAAAPNLETFKFSARDVTTWLLGVDVSMPRGGSLNGDSGFSYRLANPTIYQESHITVNNQPVDIMTDKTVNFGKVAYVLNGPLLVTVSLYGDDAQGPQPLQTSFMMVLNSLRWL
jgi:hypothetical protein